MPDQAAVERRDDMFPVVENFTRDPLTVSFASKAELQEWARAEVEFWNSLSAGAGDHFARPLTNNVQMLNNVGSSGTEEEIISRLRSIESKYVPSKATFGALAARLLDKLQAAKRIAFGDLFAELDVPWQNSADTLSAKMLVLIFRSFGSLLNDRERVDTAVADVEVIRAEHAEQLTRFKNRLTEIDAEWQRKLQGYETKVALGAPRRYWRIRARKHQKLAKGARCAWNASLVGVVALGAVMAFLLFTPIGSWLLGLAELQLGIPQQPQPTGNVSAWLVAEVLKRAVIFGTVLGLGVWWLKQKLRDLRSHEHLAEDAAERVTMIETYAAMKGAGLEAGDLAPVLSALYRTAATGLVQDDGGGPVLPIELIMKGVGDSIAKAR